jgi:hypothetical protein
MVAPHRPPKPCCPRCGYDQSGVVATWVDRCAVEGRCSECGTAFKWVDLFDPSRQTIPWYVEHASGMSAMLLRTGGTLTRMVLPWQLWSRVGVTARTHPARLWVWVVLASLCMQLLGAAPIGIMAHMGDQGFGWSMLDDWFSAEGFSGILRACLGGLFWPFATITVNWDIWWGEPSGLWPVIWVHCRWLSGFGLTWVVVVGVLPTTRRLAKLRWTHLNRASALYAAAAFCALTLLRAALAAEWLGTSWWAGIVWVALLGGILAWTIAWWACAVRVGWGIRSWALTILGTIAALLGGIVLATIELSVAYLMEL